MSWLRVLAHRLRAVSMKRRLDRELEEEIRSHLEMQIEEHVQQGMSPEEARFAALRKFGGVEQVKEKYRQRRSLPVVETTFQDLRYAARMLRKSPLFAVIAIFTLALGIGANTAIFSVVNAVLLRPLQYPNAERIVAIEELNEKGSRVQVTPANFLDWRAESKSFEHLAAIHARTSNLSAADESKRINLAMTSANFFQVFGLQPQMGRFFLPDEERAGHDAVAVLSYGLWQRHFGGDPSLVGQSIMLDGQPYTVVGIAPAGFQYPDRTEVWIPPYQLVPTLGPQMDIQRARGFGFLSAVALLKPGVSVKQAHDEMTAITARLRQQYPETNNKRFDRVVSLQTHLVGESSMALMLLLGAVALLLLIACANVANLLLSRAAARHKEIAIRLALGATRLRLVRQLLVESVLLGLLSGMVGLLLGWWGVDLMRRLLPVDFPRAQDIGIDLRVLGFTLLVSLVTGIVFGLVPALQSTNPDVNESLKESVRGSTGGRSRNRVRSLLIVSEVALSLVLLIGAGLLFRSFLRLQAVELGFRPQNLLTFRLTPSGANFREDPQYINFYSQVAERIKTLPGVDSVGMINTLPLVKGPTTAFRVEGRPLLTQDKWPGVNYRNVSPDYFHAVNAPVLKGRSFDAHDDASSPLVVLVNQSLVRRDFEGEDPLGKKINFGGTRPDGQPIWFEIVGVVADVRSLELNAEPTPEIYTSYMQDPFAGMSFVVRSQVEPESLIPAVHEAVRQVDKAQPVAEVRKMEQIVSEAAAQPRFNSLLLGIFASIALLLAAAGIYGVMSYSVTQRTHEIGVRMALGAQTRDVLKLVVGQCLRLTLVGLGLGLVCAFALTRVMATLLYGVKPTDPWTFASGALLLTVVALLSCYLPARRATKVDPLVALRYE
ncbi:MAG TPA: ABC transporter permease [Pyrinomonadaceae bacterium]|nr:ABC transporter permease [Pyrinomonadaceae bacterium]